MPSSVRLGWDSFWPMLITMPRNGRLSVGRELGGNDFVTWVSSRSPKVQIEILEDAPKPIQSFFFPQLSDFCVDALGIEAPRREIKPSNIRYIDNRSRK